MSSSTVSPSLPEGRRSLTGAPNLPGVQVVADDGQSVVIPGAGRFVADEAPDGVPAALTALLVPCHGGAAAAHDPRRHAAAPSSR